MTDRVASVELAHSNKSSERKCRFPDLTTLDAHRNRLRAVNAHPAAGWASVAFGPDGDEQKHKFLGDADGPGHYDGVEQYHSV